MARELKYHSPNTDLAALQRELGGAAAAKSDEQLDDEYDEYDADEDSEDADDDPNWAIRRSR
ncbi:hypothetical protein HDA40_004376 [Hamadaea flava]|nr:hypothetical protein [Hamadaea flava]